MLSICLFLILCLGISEECPPPESLTPCLCRIEPLSKAREILCYDINNEQTLSNAISAIRGRTDIYGVKIQDSVLNYIPHDTFSDVRIKELEISDSSLSSLSDTDIAFEGLEDYLDNLFFTDCIFMGSWDWEKLKNLRRLLSLEIRGGQFESIDKDIKDIGHLDIKIFNFARNKISYIDDEAFAMFKNLLSLDLSDNFITEMKRDMLPNPALNLRKIDLR
ncbi:protein artichoke-like [Uloborus diversus]|uniref:protein artichoke-like n=1 Tax=Uloborus diversus TaxID=327109 RepID=UPI002409E9F6|nr:protein artichoke-like [Uloborus diversus]